MANKIIDKLSNKHPVQTTPIPSMNERDWLQKHMPKTVSQEDPNGLKNNPPQTIMEK
jgi:hypothetical protein